MLRETKGSVMTDDPREVLKAAGVECAELDEFLTGRGPSEWEDDDDLDAAFLALARLVAKYKWQLGRVLADEVGVFDGGTDEWGNVVPDDSRELADLDRRWNERDA